MTSLFFDFLFSTFQQKFGEDLEIIDKGEKFDDGDYFKMGADGKVTLRKGTKKIDLSKMTNEDLAKLGIDAKYMTKDQIAKKLKVCDFTLMIVVFLSQKRKFLELMFSLPFPNMRIVCMWVVCAHDKMNRQTFVICFFPNRPWQYLDQV